MKKSIDEIVQNPIRDQGMTIEEIESAIRAKKSHELDLENTDFTNQFKAALKNGLAKHRYMKDGKYYKMANFPPLRVCMFKEIIYLAKNPNVVRRMVRIE